MTRSTTRLHCGYQFHLFPGFDADPSVFAPDFDDSQWQSVRVPHDWAITGEFKETNDTSYSAVVADGIEAPIKHSGRSGGLPIIGQGVYRLPVEIPAEDEGKSISLEFDGSMWETRVYVNGKEVYFNHFGYRAFSVDITDYIEYGKTNLIAADVRVLPDCGRWYPGAGIFRNVYLVKKSREHINYNGVWLRQLETSDRKANFELCLDYTGPDTLTFHADILDPQGRTVCTVEHGVCMGELSDIFTIEPVQLWDVDHPNLYTARISLLNEAGAEVDDTSLTFGARYFEFTRDKGFFLNGRRLKMQGVCNHHDLGSVGAAVNVAALRRQLRIMREMGVNAIRTSHNPPSPELLQLCDELGFLVMEEFFDEWYTPKIKNGYSNYFQKHAIEDVKAVVTHDRNHPSIVIWSIGNEVLEQTSPEGWRPAKKLADFTHQCDPTRPVTCGFSYPQEHFDNHLTDFVDVVGMNYKPHLYAKYHEEHPTLKFVATETASAVSSSGIYHLPPKIEIPAPELDDLTVSSYEMAAPGWAYYAERELAAQDQYPFMAGEFVWTGIDYLGEPTPYYDTWPARSSFFGAVDLSGLPKNRFYLYRSHWTREPVLHIFPHWNWEGMEGKIVPVHVYTNYPKAELFVNGKSYGVRALRTDFENGDMGQIERYRLMWDQVVYEPGTVKVVAFNDQGDPVQEAEVRTAGAPAKILLSADRSQLAADGEDLVYITASITDEQGVLCPHADHRLFFHAEGSGQLLATDNGDQRGLESFARADKKALSGHCVGCVRAAESAGALTVTVTADGLESGSITVTVQ